MNTALNRILLTRQLKLALIEGTGTQPGRAISALLTDIAQLGFTLDGDLVRLLKTYNDIQLAQFRRDLVESLRDMVGADVAYKPLFATFPHDLPDTDRYYTDRLIGHLQTLFGYEEEGAVALSCGHVINPGRFNLAQFTACPICQMTVDELDGADVTHAPLEDITPLKVIRATPETTAWAIATHLMGAKASLSEQDRTDLTVLMAAAGPAIVDHLPEQIVFKETLVLVTEQLLKQRNGAEAVLDRYYKTATDVLRLAVQFSGGDVSLATPTKFKLSNAQRRLVLSLLDNVKAPDEDLKRHTEMWKRLGHCLHVNAYRKRYPHAAAALYRVRNEAQNIQTFNGQVEALIQQAQNGDQSVLTALLALLQQRPGEFTRRLDFMLRQFEDTDLVAEAYEVIVEQVTTPMLLTVAKHLSQRAERRTTATSCPRAIWARCSLRKGISGRF